MTATAQVTAPVQAVIAVSPDHHYEVIVQNDAWCIRDTRSKNIIQSPDIDEPFTPTEGTALWSPDSQKVIFIYRVNKHAGNEYFVLALKESKLTVLHLPTDAIPIKWTGANSLLCSVRSESVLDLNEKTGSFNPKISTSPKK